MYTKLNFDKGAYDTLNSNGLEYISNDSLRSQIVRAYELEFPRILFFGDEKRSDFVHEKRDRLLEILLDVDVVPRDKIFTITESVTLNTTQKISALKRLMHLQIALSKRYQDLLSRQIILINNLLLPIDKELEKLEH